MRKVWTEEEIEVLKQRYATESTASLAEFFNCQYGAVANKAGALKLKKDPEYLKTILNELCKNLEKSGKSSQFKSGNVSHNKGKKMSAELYEKVSKTFFKKGNKPVNTKEGVGMVVSRKDKSGYMYNYIKIADSKWVPLHRHLYEAKFGPIPPNMNLNFIDGNSQNCELENLQLITKKEQRIKNAGHQTLNDKYVSGLMARNGRKIDKELALKLANEPELLKLKKYQILLKRETNETRK
jgi:hypothetical protein